MDMKIASALALALYSLFSFRLARPCSDSSSLIAICTAPSPSFHLVYCLVLSFSLELELEPLNTQLASLAVNHPVRPSFVSLFYFPPVSRPEGTTYVMKLQVA